MEDVIGFRENKIGNGRNKFKGKRKDRYIATGGEEAMKGE